MATTTNSGHVQYHALENAVSAERHDVVHYIVAARDRAEDCANALGFFFCRDLLVAEINLLGVVRVWVICGHECSRSFAPSCRLSLFGLPLANRNVG